VATPEGLPAAATVAYLYAHIMLARPRTLPTGFIAPCLPTQTHTLPSGGLWLHEIKHDGFRVIARKDGPRCGSIAGPAMTSPVASR
jgi:ATP-dependent DNA ligase